MTKEEKIELLEWAETFSLPEPGRKEFKISSCITISDMGHTIAAYIERVKQNIGNPVFDCYAEQLNDIRHFFQKSYGI